jgi:hypothetical protein
MHRPKYELGHEMKNPYLDKRARYFDEWSEKTQPYSKFTSSNLPQWQTHEITGMQVHRDRVEHDEKRIVDGQGLNSEKMDNDGS